MTQPEPDINRLLHSRNISALIFDLDGVVTQTAKVHARAWKKMFDKYLLEKGKTDGKIYQPLDIKTDYPKYIDGIQRYDGVRNFLRSRGITLPEGNPTDKPGSETVAALGNQKKRIFQECFTNRWRSRLPRYNCLYKTAPAGRFKNCHHFGQ